MWVSMLSMWGCRVVVGYVLGIMLGWGVVGVWMGMFATWAVGVLFNWRDGWILQAAMDIHRQEVIKANALADENANYSANDFKFKEASAL